MIRCATRLGLAALAGLVLAVPAGAFPHIKPPIVHPHIKPPPPPPGLKNAGLWSPFVPYAVVHTHMHQNHKPGSTLQDALRDLRAAHGAVDKSHPGYDAALSKVLAAEHIVARDKKLASDKKETHRAESLGSVLKAIEGASHDVAGHRAASRESVGHAAHELEAFLNGKKPAGKKPGKN
jgi:hypothetical protein